MKKLLLSEKEFSILMFILFFLNILLNVLNVNLSGYTEMLSIVVFILLILINLKEKRYFRSPIYIFTFGLIIVTYLSTYLYNKDYTYTLFLPILIIIYYIVPRRVNINSLISKDKFINLFIINMIVLIDILSLINGKMLIGTTRLSGIFGHPNTLALFNLCGVFSVFQILLNIKNNIRFCVLVPLAFFALVMVLTNSRTSMLVAVIYIALVLFYLLVSNRNITAKRKLLVFSAVIMLTLVILMIKRDSILAFLFRGGNLEGIDLKPFLNAITSNRYYMWTKEFPYLMEGNWLIGNGVNSYLEIAYKKHMLDSIIIKDMLASSHNFMLDIIFISGFVGLVLFIAECILIFSECFKRIRNSENKSKFILNKCIIVFCMSVYFLFEVNFLWYNSFSNLFLLLNISLIINYSFNAGKEVYDEQ